MGMGIYICGRKPPGTGVPLGTGVVIMIALAVSCLPAAALDGGSAPSHWLLPQRLSSSRLFMPGDRSEDHVYSERSFRLGQGIAWQTSTDLSRTRLEQMYPVGTDGISLSTGPQIRLGATELALPFSTGRDSRNVGGGSTWSGGAPRMTVALGPYDRVRLEASLRHRNAYGQLQRRQSAALTWRHSVNEDWSLTTGLRQIRDSGGDTDGRVIAETYASIDGLLANGWRWSLASSLSDARYPEVTGLQPYYRDRSTSLSVSTRYRLVGGWWLSGDLRSTQSYRSDEMRGLTSYSGGLRLHRNF